MLFKLLCFLFLIAIVLYALIAFFMYRFQEQFIFYPTTLPSNFAFAYFPNTEEHFFELDRSTTLHALHFKSEQPKGIILYFHGNARALDDWGYVAQEFTKHQWDVFMPDYRTYGKSTGPLSETALYSDATFFYDFLKKQYPEKQIIIYGRSLGTGVATELAVHHKPQLLILETPYSSILALAKRTAPFLPISYLLNYHFRNDQKIAQINAPIHILHGTQDYLIPLAHAQQLHQLAGDNATLTTIEGGNHNDLSDFDVFQKTIAQLLE